jgi:hypothetical protein
MGLNREGLTAKVAKDAKGRGEGLNHDGTTKHRAF